MKGHLQEPKLSWYYGENSNLDQGSLAIQWISLLRKWVWSASKKQGTDLWVDESVNTGHTEGSQNGASLDSLFSPPQGKEEKSHKQRQTCSCLSHHSASTHTVPLPTMFLPSKRLSEKSSTPNVTYPKLSPLGRAIFKYHNLLIL